MRTESLRSAPSTTDPFAADAPVAIHDVADSRAERATTLSLRLLLALYLLSRVSGLVYQVLWQRMLTIVFGVSAHATATVLAAFMAGLALGGFVAAELKVAAGLAVARWGLGGGGSRRKGDTPIADRRPPTTLHSVVRGPSSVVRRPSSRDVGAPA